MNDEKTGRGVCPGLFACVELTDERKDDRLKQDRKMRFFHEKDID